MEKLQYLDIDRKVCFEIAQRYFDREAGINKTGEKYKKMKDEGYRIHDMVKDRIEYKACYTYYNDFNLEGKSLTIGNTSIECQAWEQINPAHIKGVYCYAVNAGDFYLENEPILIKLYADIWGTAYCDAIRDIMLENIRNESKLSDSFGPGFYGMSPAEMEKMTELTDFEQLGLEVRPSGIILPLKSCAGIFFDVTEAYESIADACQFCYGQYNTCRLCGINKVFDV